MEGQWRNHSVDRAYRTHEDFDGSDEGGGTIQKEVQRFISSAKSFVITNRQSAGSSVLQTLRNVASSPEDVATVLQHLATLAVDYEVEVRTTSLFYIPHIAMFFSDPYNPDDSLRGLITTHILPIIVTALKDTDMKVVKLADSSVIALLEHWLIPSKDLRESVWPAILYGLRHGQTSDTPPESPPNVEAAVRIVTMMSKMVPWVGCDETESLFVPLFSELCSHPEFLVRQACASIIGDFCAVFQANFVESKLVPKLVALSEDSAWGVRRAVAESILPAAAAAGTEQRRGVLTSVYASLLADKHGAVQAAAFAALGPFISTFAPGNAILEHNHLGELVLRHGVGYIFKLNNSRTGSLTDSVEDVTNSLSAAVGSLCSTTIDCRSSSDIASNEETEEEGEFNSSIYWRDPIPDIDLDPKILDPPVTEEFTDMPFKDLIMLAYNQSNSTDKYRRLILKEKIKSDGELIEEKTSMDKPCMDENAVPSQLIEWFTSMSAPPGSQEWRLSSQSGLDEKSNVTLAHHCAYNIPAVALTLGPNNWALLKETYEQLAADKQWKVRRIVASSIHELAGIVGPEIATRDLVPIFCGFIKDLDEVRIGALKNLANFIWFIFPSGRLALLPKLSDFLVTDYDWNWRFRYELSEQLVVVVDQESYQPSDVAHYITPICITLLQDRAADVRISAYNLMSNIMHDVSEDASVMRGLVCTLAEQFAHSSRWVRRQTFAHLCSVLVDKNAVPFDLFARDILPHFLDLSWDKVPNVRLAVARALSSSILECEFFSNTNSPYYEVLQINLKRLQGDRDQDVRALARPQENPCKWNQCHKELEKSTDEIGSKSDHHFKRRHRMKSHSLYLMKELRNFSKDLTLGSAE